jgi:hypothetical protein
VSDDERRRSSFLAEVWRDVFPRWHAMFSEPDFQAWYQSLQFSEPARALISRIGACDPSRHGCSAGADELSAQESGRKSPPKRRAGQRNPRRDPLT